MVDWKAYEGQIVDGVFTLGEFLGGSERCGTFATSEGPRSEVIRLHPAEGRNVESQLTLWERISRLSHPNLMHLFRWGRCQLEEQPMIYVVTEKADEVLEHTVRERPLELDEVRQLIEPTLEALTYLHDRGYVHGRVRPSHLFAVAETVKLSSDGIVPLLEAGREPREKSAYDAPEMASGLMTTASDVWSLGWTLIEVLTQQPPGKGSLPEPLPEPFEEIVQHALKADPAERWTVQRIARRLRGEGIEGPASGAGTARRYAIPLVAAAAAVLLGIWVWTRPNSEAQAPDRPAVAATPAPVPVAKQPSTAKSEKPSPMPVNDSASRKSAAKREPAPVQDTPGPAPRQGALPPDVVEQVLPRVSAQAQRSVTGRVRTTVVAEVDNGGNVKSTRLESGRSQYFNRISMEAVRQWKFAPGSTRPRVISFEFTSRGPSVTSVR